MLQIAFTFVLVLVRRIVQSAARSAARAIASPETTCGPRANARPECRSITDAAPPGRKTWECTADDDSLVAAVGGGPLTLSRRCTSPGSTGRKVTVTVVLGS